jgi:hypothetical protein
MKGVDWECSFYAEKVKGKKGWGGGGGIKRERSHLKDLDIDRKIILKWVVNK